MRLAWVLGAAALAAAAAAVWAFGTTSPSPEPWTEEAGPRAETAAPGHLLAGRATTAVGAQPEAVPRATVTGVVRRGGSPVAARVELRRAGGPAALPRWRGGDVRPDLLVSLGDRDGPVLAVAAAGEDGAFAFESLPAGTYEARARADDGAEGFALLDVGPHHRTATLEIEVPGGPEVLRGVAVHADGRPFAGIVVAQPWREVDADDHADLAGSVIGPTDADGRFELRGLSSGPWMLSVLEPGRWRSILQMWRLPYGGEVRLEVDAGQREVLGRVVAAATGAPVPGARVAVESSAVATWSTHAVATTDDQGRFRVRTSVQEFDVRVDATGFSPIHRTVHRPGDEVVLRLPAPARVEGRVVDPAGAPVAGAVVHCVDQGYLHLDTRSDAEGRFAFPAAPVARLQVFVLGGGWASRALDRLFDGEAEPFAAAPAPDETVRVELRVVPSARLRGHVTHADGRPASGAVVEAASYVTGSPPRATTGADGAYLLEDLVPDVEMEVTAHVADVHPVSEDVTPRGDRESVLDLRLPPARRVEVRVTSGGKPIAGATVMLSVGDESDPDVRGLGVPTGADGVALLRAVPDGRVWVGAIAKGHVASGPLPVTGVPDETGLVRETIALDTGISIAGRVSLTDGGSPAGAWVTLSARDFEVHAPVGADGSYTFDGVPADGWSVEAELVRGGVRYSGGEGGRDESGRLATDLELSPSEPDEEGPTLVVTVSDASGARVPTGRLRIVGPDDAGRPRDVRDMEWHDGSARIVLLDNERSRIWLVASNARDDYGNRLPLGPTVVGPLRPDDGAVEVRMEPGLEIAGVVLGPDGEPGHGYRIEASPLGDGTPLMPATGVMPTTGDVITAADAQGAFRSAGSAR